ncbi:MAG: hypothetical protein M1820_010551 [Bogoriella megaspora]|nr:MAG: hypothetical protein M1820_010551 [Bogoriella megaspora]
MAQRLSRSLLRVAGSQLKPEVQTLLHRSSPRIAIARNSVFQTNVQQSRFQKRYAATASSTAAFPPTAPTPNTTTVDVPHLGGITAAYQTALPINPDKPTLILVNSFTTSSELYRSQFANVELTERMNLVAIELLGHGQTRTKTENWSYWDTAQMNLEVMDALNIPKAFVLGTSQGGWITARMALLAPKRIQGIIPLGTSMDKESERSRAVGCWDAPNLLTPNIEAWTSETETKDFDIGEEFADFLIDIGFGKNCPMETRDTWRELIRANYKGDEGRRRARMAAINLRDRDGLHERLKEIKCPVLWLHGTDDAVYSVENAQHEIKMFTNSPDAKLEVVKGGQHFLSSSNRKEVDQALINFVGKYGKSN